VSGQRKRRGFGAVRQLRSGRFQASYVGPDGMRYLSDTTYTSKADADVWLSTIRADIVRRTWKAPQRTSERVDRYVARWIEQRPGSAPGTTNLAEAKRAELTARRHRAEQQGRVLPGHEPDGCLASAPSVPAAACSVGDRGHRRADRIQSLCRDQRCRASQGRGADPDRRRSPTPGAGDLPQVSGAGAARSVLRPALR